MNALSGKRSTCEPNVLMISTYMGVVLIMALSVGAYWGVVRVRGKQRKSMLAHCNSIMEIMHTYSENDQLKIAAHLKSIYELFTSHGQ